MGHLLESFVFFGSHGDSSEHRWHLSDAALLGISPPLRCAGVAVADAALLAETVDLHPHVRRPPDLDSDLLDRHAVRVQPDDEVVTLSPSLLVARPALLAPVGAGLTALRAGLASPPVARPVPLAALVAMLVALP